MKMLKFIYICCLFIDKCFYKFLIMPIKKSMLAKCGKNVILGKKSNIYYKNVSVGNKVSIGTNACFLCKLAKIIIGDNVMFGPNVSVITGGLRTDLVGE